MSILIVDDNPVSAKLIDLILRKTGYDTIVVHSGKDALQHLESNSQTELIISDVVMPEMDGLELIKRVKERPEWKETPVLICSVMADVETIKRCVEAGCRKYVLKPIKAAQLLEKVRETIAYEKPTLKEKKMVLSEIGIDSNAYEQILREFAAQVNESIVHLERAAAEKPDSQLSTKLASLYEGASLVGAERLKMVLDRHVSIDSRNVTLHNEDSGYPLILRELNLLKSSLPSINPPIPTAPPHDGEK
jgi:two-component system, chemotaxis family, chemotaxis protein CheY